MYIIFVVILVKYKVTDFGLITEEYFFFKYFSFDLATT